MTLNNKQRRELLDRARASGYTGSIIDVYQGHRQGRDVIAEFEAQKQGNIAVTPSQQQAGLGPAHQAGRTGESMIFPNIGPNATMTTANKGLKVNLDVKGYDDRGHLVKSYDSVPPGVKTLPMGPRATTVVETPARYQYGGPKTGGPRVSALSDAEMSLKIIKEANAGNPAARRMRADYGQRTVLKGETDPSTHFMASIDKYAVPLVQEDYIGGPLNYNENPAPSKADFKFDTPEQAEYFAKNYKKATAAKAFKNKRLGGFLSDI